MSFNNNKKTDSDEELYEFAQEQEALREFFSGSEPELLIEAFDKVSNIFYIYQM